MCLRSEKKNSPIKQSNYASQLVFSAKMNDKESFPFSTQVKLIQCLIVSLSDLKGVNSWPAVFLALQLISLSCFLNWINEVIHSRVQLGDCTRCI